MTAIHKDNKHRRLSRSGYVGFEVIGALKVISGLAALSLGVWF